MRILLAIICSFFFYAVTAQDYFKQGDACYTQKNYSCAYDNYMKGYEANLPSVKNILYYRIGYSLSSLRRYEEAKRWFWRALAEKTDLDATWALAFAHYSLFKYDSAAIYYKKAYGMATANEHKKTTSYYAGLSYFLAKNYLDANAQFTTCLKIDSTDINTQTYLARCYYAVKNYTTAEKNFRKVLELSKDSLNMSYAHKMIGECAYSQKKYPSAIESYQTALKYNPRDGNILGYLGDAYFNYYKIDSAKQFYTAAIEMEKKQKYPDSVFLGSMSAGIVKSFFREKDTITAVKKLIDLIKYDIESEVLSDFFNELVIRRKDVKSMESMMPFLVDGYRSVKMNSQLAWLYNSAAKVYEELKQQPKSASYYKLAVQANYPPTDYIGAGLIRSLLRDKKIKEASDSINKWEVLPTQYPSLYKPFILNMKGRIAYAQNDTVTAAKFFRESSRTNLYAYEPNFFLGKMAIDRKDTNSCYNFWVRINNAPTTFGTEQDNALMVYKFMGQYYFEKAPKNGNYAAATYTNAADMFDRVLAIDSSSATIRLFAGVSHLQARRTYTGKSHLLKAVNVYQKKKDTLAIVYRWLAFAELRGETIPNYTNAYNYYQKGIEANANDSSIYNDMATAYFQQKNYVKAAEVFGKNLAIQKGSANKAICLYNRALCYYYTKQKNEGLADVAKSLELNPTYSDAIKLKVELEKLSGQ